jgi:small conductance mechanosensitive channel
VGDTVLVQGVSGVVDEVTLAHTVLIGEDLEKITIPNRKIVGEILINSDAHRIVES